MNKKLVKKVVIGLCIMFVVLFVLANVSNSIEQESSVQLFLESKGADNLGEYIGILLAEIAMVTAVLYIIIKGIRGISKKMKKDN